MNEKGYILIENDVFRGLARLRVSVAGFKVILVIIIYTIGFNRDRHTLSNGFIAEQTGLSVRTVIRAIHDLEKEKTIEIVSENCGSHPRTIRIRTDNIIMLANPKRNSDNIEGANGDNLEGANTDRADSQENTN